MACRGKKCIKRVTTLKEYYPYPAKKEIDIP
jgi:hypothetical protein